MDKKPRSDSKLDALEERRKLALRDGLLGGWKYEAALAWLEAECGVRSSLDALTRFWRRHCAPVLKERRQLASLRAEALGAEAGKTDWDSASIELLKQAAFEAMSNPEADPEAVERIFKLLLKARALDQSGRRIELLEAQAAQAKAQLEAAAGRAKAGGGISEETLREIEAAAKLL